MKRWQGLVPAYCIFLLALLIRLIYNLTVAHDYYPLFDSLAYQNIALNMLHAHCFCIYAHTPTVYRAPLWPMTIAAIYALAGQHNFFVRLFLCGVGSGTCVLTLLFARDLFGTRIGWLAGGIAAVYPELFIYDGWLYSESLTIFLCLALCYALYRLQHATQQRRRIWIISGILLALIALVRPNGLLMLGLFILWVALLCWTKQLSWRQGIRGTALSFLISLIFIAPWTIRNYTVSHTFVPIATGDGTVLLGAYNDLMLAKPHYIGAWISPTNAARSVASKYPLACPATCEVKREADYKDHALQWIGEHLSSIPFLLETHFMRIWQPDTQEADLPTQRFQSLPATQNVLEMMRTFPIRIFALAALGVVVTWRRWREFLFIYLFIALTIAECLLFYGSPRFRAPLEPLLILFACGAIWWLFRITSATPKGSSNSATPAPQQHAEWLPPAPAGVAKEYHE